MIRKNTLLLKYKLKSNKIFNLLHNNTTKTISKTAKSSLLMKIVYHLKSSTTID